MKLPSGWIFIPPEWETPEDVMEWWLEEKPIKQLPGQIEMEWEGNGQEKDI